jgi:hypothetical protein
MKRKMILRWTLYATVLLTAVALITGVALARTGGGVMFGAAGNHSLNGMMDLLDAPMLSGGHYQLTHVTLNDTMDQPETMMLSGGHYQLTNMTLSYAQGIGWQESDLASGGGYHLMGLASPQLASPQLTGDGCCCLYLPCVRR